MKNLFGSHQIHPQQQQQGNYIIGQITTAQRSSRNNNHVPTKLNILPSMLRASRHTPTPLPAGYHPGDNDVCCGRGKRNWNHKGNVRFRNLVQSNVRRYMGSPTKNDKTLVVISIVEEVRERNGKFLKQDNSERWYDIGDAQAREKVGHSLRDQVTALSKNKDKGKNTTKGGSRKATVAASAAAAAAAAAPPAPKKPRLERRLSDTQRVTETRRSSLLSSLIVDAFARRPSLLAESFSDKSTGGQSSAGDDSNSSKSLGHKRLPIADQINEDEHWAVKPPPLESQPATGGQRSRAPSSVDVRRLSWLNASKELEYPGPANQARLRTGLPAPSNVSSSLPEDVPRRRSTWGFLGNLKDIMGNFCQHDQDATGELETDEPLSVDRGPRPYEVILGEDSGSNLTEVSRWGA